MKTISSGDAVEQLLGTECKGCGGKKPSRKSHCSKCYYKLNDRLRFRLYQRVGAGYEEAYTESLKVLAKLNAPAEAEQLGLAAPEGT